MNEKQMPFHEWLAKAMKEAGIASKVELAELSGNSKQYVGQMLDERQRKIPTRPRIDRLAGALNVPRSVAYTFAGYHYTEMPGNLDGLILSYFRDLNDHYQGIALALIKALHKLDFSERPKDFAEDVDDLPEDPLTDSM